MYKSENGIKLKFQIGTERWKLGLLLLLLLLLLCVYINSGLERIRI
jgi:hypothetical protein